MSSLKDYKIYLLVLSIFCISFITQANLLASWDVSWGLHETKKILAGGRYGREIFEFSPPVFLYLYSPIIFLSKNFPINIFLALKLYVFLLGLLSLFSCYLLIKKILTSNNLISVFISALAIIFFLLPLPYDFGQREHLLVILVMPYLLAVACRLQNVLLSRYLTLFVGLAAGLGFAIKPFYLLAFIFIELYTMIAKRSWLAWLRVESMVVIVVLFMYLLTLYYSYTSYLSNILVLASHTYYQGYGSAWAEMFFRSNVYYCFLCVLLYVFLCRSSPYKYLSAILLLAFLGFFIAYGMQKTIWYYHLLPAYSLSVLLIFLLFGSFVMQEPSTKFNYAIMLVIALLMFLFDLHYLKEFLRIPAFYLTLFFLLGAFVLIAKNKMHALFSAVLGVLIFVYPVYSMMDRYWYALGYKKIMTPLLSYMYKNMRNQTVYFLTTNMTYQFPIVDYARAIPVSKYPELVWIPGYVKQKRTPQLIKDHNYFVADVAEEILTQHPSFILVDVLANKSYLNGIAFDFVENFSQNDKFKRAWSHYRYVTIIDHYPDYKLQVYERVRKSNS